VGGLGIALHVGHVGLLGEPAGDQDPKGIVAAAVEPDIDGASKYLGRSISAEDVALASPATALQGHMVNSSRVAAVVCRPVSRPYQDHASWGCCRSDCYSLALCSSELREDAWR